MGEATPAAPSADVARWPFSQFALGADRARCHANLDRDERLSVRRRRLVTIRRSAARWTAFTSQCARHGTRSDARAQRGALFVQLDPGSAARWRWRTVGLLPCVVGFALRAHASGPRHRVPRSARGMADLPVRGSPRVWSRAAVALPLTSRRVVEVR